MLSHYATSNGDTLMPSEFGKLNVLVNNAGIF